MANPQIQPSKLLDDLFIFQLANFLTIPELRSELRWAELNSFLADYFQDDSFPYSDYSEACKEAIQWQRAKPRSTTQTPHYKKVDIQAVKSKSDIVEIVERYTPLKKSGSRYFGLCPLHSDKKSPSLVVYPDQQTWHCFGCNRGGDVIAFIQAIENTDFRGAAAILGGQ